MSSHPKAAIALTGQSTTIRGLHILPSLPPVEPYLLVISACRYPFNNRERFTPNDHQKSSCIPSLNNRADRMPVGCNQLLVGLYRVVKLRMLLAFNRL